MINLQKKKPSFEEMSINALDIFQKTQKDLQAANLQGEKEAEQVALAKAKVAAAQGDYDAGVLNAKTQDLLSQPKMLEKQRIDNERIMWTGYAKTGKSPFGENNIFGGSGNSTPMLMLQR